MEAIARQEKKVHCTVFLEDIPKKIYLSSLELKKMDSEISKNLDRNSNHEKVEVEITESMLTKALSTFGEISPPGFTFIRSKIVRLQNRGQKSKGRIMYEEPSSAQGILASGTVDLNLPFPYVMPDGGNATYPIQVVVKPFERREQSMSVNTQGSSRNDVEPDELNVMEKNSSQNTPQPDFSFPRAARKSRLLIPKLKPSVKTTKPASNKDISSNTNDITMDEKPKTSGPNASFAVSLLGG